MPCHVPSVYYDCFFQTSASPADLSFILNLSNSLFLSDPLVIPSPYDCLLNPSLKTALVITYSNLEVQTQFQKRSGLFVNLKLNTKSHIMPNLFDIPSIENSTRKMLGQGQQKTGEVEECYK